MLRNDPSSILTGKCPLLRPPPLENAIFAHFRPFRPFRSKIRAFNRSQNRRGIIFYPKASFFIFKFRSLNIFKLQKNMYQVSLIRCFYGMYYDHITHLGKLSTKMILIYINLESQILKKDIMWPSMSFEVIYVVHKKWIYMYNDIVAIRDYQ